LDEQTRALTRDDDLGAESPLLLDPVSLLDVALLWFDDSGETRPHPILAADEDGLEARRVEVSREVYHLDHPAIVTRRRRVYREVSRLVRDVDRAFRELASQRTVASKALFESALLELRSKVAPTAEHSLAARCALRGYRAESEMAQAVLDSL
jgi:hypothetical protein